MTYWSCHGQGSATETEDRGSEQGVGGGREEKAELLVATVVSEPPSLLKFLRSRMTIEYIVHTSIPFRVNNNSARTACIKQGLNCDFGEGNGTPLQYSCLDNPVDGGAFRLQSMGSQRVGTAERPHFHFSLSCTGEGNGNPLQCSCLENPRDGGAWWAAVCGVAQSRTRLKRFSSSGSSNCDLWSSYS